MRFIRIRCKDLQNKFTREACYRVDSISSVFVCEGGYFFILPRHESGFECEILGRDGRKITNITTLFKMINEE